MNARPALAARVETPPRPRRLVLLGHPVAHTLSPTFQNAALEAAGLALRYEPLDTLPTDLARVLGDLKRARGAGNVTVPHKQTVLAACDTLTPIAKAVGAVNTFWCATDGALVGDNTDVDGAAAALRDLTSAIRGVPTSRVALLGAGGAATAVVAAVQEVWPHAQLRVWSRRPAQADVLAARYGAGVSAVATLDDALQEVDVVVNATPLGLHPNDVFPCAIGALPPGAAVLDLVYGPQETAWVRAARTAGHHASDGLLMLVEQGAAAFERWFGYPPDRTRMWRAVQARTGRAIGSVVTP